MSPVVLPLRWACAVIFLGVLAVNTTSAQTGGARSLGPASSSGWEVTAPLPSAVSPSPKSPTSASARTTPADAPASQEAPTPGSVPVDYKIGPNDLLDIEVFGVSELKRQVRVNTTGHVSMPLIGLVPLAGLSPVWPLSPPWPSSPPAAPAPAPLAGFFFRAGGLVLPGAFVWCVAPSGASCSSSCAAIAASS